jgi:hypothetical protein
MRNFQTIWQNIEDHSKKIADIQAKILLTLLYYLFVAPTGFVARLSDDALRLRRPRRAVTHWQPKALADHTLKQAQRQG